jgi:hypothetical protein
MNIFTFSKGFVCGILQGTKQRSGMSVTICVALTTTDSYNFAIEAMDDR